MTNDPDVLPIFLLIGPPAVGKSTTSRALAGRFARSIHIPVDTIREMVVSGLVLPAAEWSQALTQQVSLARAAACRMALSYHEAGFAVVIDDFWDANLPADYLALDGHTALRRAILFPDQQEAHRRNLARAGDDPGRHYIDAGISIVYDQLREVAARLALEGWQIIDTTHMSVDETVDQLVHSAAAILPGRAIANSPARSSSARQSPSESA